MLTVDYSLQIIIFEILATLYISLNYFISENTIYKLNILIDEELNKIKKDLTNKKYYYPKTFLVLLLILLIIIGVKQYIYPILKYEISIMNLFINFIAIVTFCIMIFIFFKNISYLSYKFFNFLYQSLRFIKKGILAGIGIFILLESFILKLLDYSKIDLGVSINYFYSITTILILITFFKGYKLQTMEESEK